jgi:dipeptidyl aminopeptidase/acylaminoacyl peptidase
MRLKEFSVSILFLFATILCSGRCVDAQTANFQQAKEFTTKKMQKLVGSTSVRPHWIKHTNRFWYQYKTPEGKNWYFVDADKRSQHKIFKPKKMTSRLTEIFHKPFDYKDLKLKDFKYNGKKDVFTFHVDSINFNFDMKDNELIKKDSVKKKPSDRWKTYSPDSTWIAFAKNYNLYLMRANDPDSTEYRLTANGVRWYNYQAKEGDTTSNKRLRSRVHWFKDSNKLYVNRQDKRKVKPLWVIHSLHQPRPKLETYKYAMPGDKNIPRDEIWVFKADTLPSTKGVKLKIKKKEWPDAAIDRTYRGSGSKYLYLLRRNRERNKIDVLKANTITGDTKILFSETDKPYFNPRFISLHVIGDGQQFIWWSERTGWGQLYRYDSDGKLINRITHGHYTAGNIVKIDTTAKTIYFNGYGREKGISPYYSQLYKIKFDGSSFKRLTKGNATHSIRASDKGNYFVDNYSRVDLPTTSVLRDGSGKVLMNLQKTNVTPLKKLGWQPPQPFKFKAADGVTNLYGVMWKPFNFDSTKSYPIISYVYPGPQTEPFPIGFRFTAHTALAQLGFIVVAMGERGGSPLRPKYYHTYGYGDLRDYPLKDNKVGIEELAARHHYIDLNRVGIWGHSGGGFMSTAEILTYPDFYDVAWSESGNHDNNVYNLWWSEAHNGVKKVTKTIKIDDGHGGKKDSTVTKWDAHVETNMELSKNLKGHLMLVTGTADDNVNPANTIRMADALLKAGKKFDYMILPDKPHGYGNDEPYVVRRRWRYFARYLLGWQPKSIQINLPKKGKANKHHR